MNSFFVINENKEFNIPEAYDGYLIFYKKNKNPEIATLQLALLSKLIENGLKLSLDNFLIVDVSEHQSRLSAIKKRISIQKCFLFGVFENEIGINFDIPMYKLITIGSVEFLKSDAPELLEQEKNLKNHLWAQLQKSFKLVK